MWVSEGSLKPIPGNGYLHILKKGVWRAKQITTLPPSNTDCEFFKSLADDYSRGAKEERHRIAALAENLGLPERTLHHLQVGWSPGNSAYSIPMKGGAGRVIGVHLRKLSGAKFAVKGSRLGLFVPRVRKKTSRLILSEGASDCAALLSLGFWVVGRPSCSGGIQHVLEYVRLMSPKEVIVFSDQAEHEIEGAQKIATQVRLLVPTVRVVTPPGNIKDARAWKNLGASYNDVLNRIRQSAPMTMKVRHA